MPVESSVYLPFLGFLPGWYWMTFSCNSLKKTLAFNPQSDTLSSNWSKIKGAWSEWRLFVTAPVTFVSKINQTSSLYLFLVCRSPCCPQIPSSLQTLCVVDKNVFKLSPESPFWVCLRLCKRPPRLLQTNSLVWSLSSWEFRTHNLSSAGNPFFKYCSLAGNLLRRQLQVTQRDEKEIKT